jgi:hypothetical protein
VDPSLLVSAVDLGLKPSAVLACHLHQRTKADRRRLVRPRRSAGTPPSQVRLRNRPRFGIAEDGREGGCSHASPSHPVNIPHDNEDRGVVTGFDEERIHRSASLSHPPPQFTKHPGPPSQRGDTGSNPVGTTQVSATSRGARGAVAPHWPRDVHPLVKGQCAPGRLPTGQMYRVYLRFRDRPRRVPSSLFDGQSAVLRLRGSLGGAPGDSRTRTEGGAGRRSRPLRAPQVARKMDPLLLSKSSRSLRARRIASVSNACQ